MLSTAIERPASVDSGTMAAVCGDSTTFSRLRSRIIRLPPEAYPLSLVLKVGRVEDVLEYKVNLFTRFRGGLLWTIWEIYVCSRRRRTC